MITIRRLTHELLAEHRQEYISILDSFRPSRDISREVLLDSFSAMESQGTGVFVACDESDESSESVWKIHIVGTITMLVEQKMLRNGAKAWHIEEFVVAQGYQWQWIWSRLVEAAIAYAQQQWCYKIIGDTTEALVPRFAKFGFDSPERMIRKYL